MKGKKIEAAKSGVDYNAPLANNSKMNIMSAAKQRKRGGAVKTAAGMPEGLSAMKRLDKPSRKRAKGGGVGDMPIKSVGSKTGPALKSKALRGDRSAPSIDKMAEKTAGKMLSSATSDDDKPARKRGGGVIGKVGGKLGADTHPISTANRERPMKGHTAQPNIT